VAGVAFAGLRGCSTIDVAVQAAEALKLSAAESWVQARLDQREETRRWSLIYVTTSRLSRCGSVPG